MTADNSIENSYKEDIITAYNKYIDCSSFPLKQFFSEAKRFPGGELLFWNQKRYEYIQRIKNESMLGQIWVNSDCIDLDEIPDYPSVIERILIDFYNKHFAYLEKYLNAEERDKSTREGIRKDITAFFKLWPEYRLINTIVENLQKGEPKSEDQHPEIFKGDGYKIFQLFIESAEKRYWIRECSFIYRQLKEKEKPSLIHVTITPARFQAWINENYSKDDLDLSEVKTYDDSYSVKRGNRYKLIKSQFNSTKK